MAFGITRAELTAWKEAVRSGEIAFLTHYWYDERFPDFRTVTKVGCADIRKLIAWGESKGLRKEWIDWYPGYPHFDLFGEWERLLLKEAGLKEQYERFYPSIERECTDFHYALYDRSPYRIHSPMTYSVLDGEAELLIEQLVTIYERLTDATDELRVITYVQAASHRPTPHYARPKMQAFFKKAVDLTKVHHETRKSQDEEGESFIEAWYEIELPAALLSHQKLLRERVFLDFSRYWPRERYFYPPTIFIENQTKGWVMHPYDDRGIEWIADTKTLYEELRHLLVNII